MKPRQSKIFAFLLAIVFMAFFTLACSGNPQNPNNSTLDSGQTDTDCSVSFIDVGEGDAIFITLPDGKCALIDCGNKEESLAKKIENFIKVTGKTKIDYFILSHPDIDHIGNALYLADKFSIGTAFLPNVFKTSSFPELGSVRDSLNNKGVRIKNSVIFDTIIGEDYKFVFLSPEDIDDPHGVYNDMHLITPTASQVNNISAVIYFECGGVRFLFTGDIDYTVESRIIDKYNIGLFDNIRGINDQPVNLNNIEFLKFSHHGAEDATSQKFLETICPTNAVFSVGADNIYGLPSSETLSRLLLANLDCNILRTDVLGNITINIVDGTYVINHKK